MLKTIKSWFKPPKKDVIELEWRSNLVYFKKNGVAIGHINWYIDDKETKDKIINLLKLMKC